MAFFEDDRAVAPLIGVLFITFFLVIGISLNQAVWVPQQNKKVEFNHNQDVHNDLADLRSDVVEAADSGEMRSTRIQLGVRYPTRVVAINPAPPAGAISSTNQGQLSVSASGDSGDLIIDDASTLCGTSSTPTSRTLTYRPGYNEFADAPNAGYDNSVFFRQYDSATLTGTSALFDGNTVVLRPVTADYSESGIRTVTADIHPTDKIGRDEVKLDSDDTLTVEFPSRLSASTWSDLLSSRSDVSISKSGDIVTIDISPSSTTEYKVLCEPVRVNRSPDATPPDDRDRPSDGSALASSNVEVVSGSISQTSKGVVEFDMRNTGSGDARVVKFAFNDTTKNNADEIDNDAGLEVSLNRTGEVDAVITRGGSPQQFSPEGELPGESGTTFTVQEFRKSSNDASQDMSGEDITFTLFFGDDSVKTYTITVP